MTVNSYVSIPSIPGSLTAHVGDTHLLTRHEGGGTITRVNWGFLDGAGPSSGQSVVIRVGRDLDLVTTDPSHFVELTITGPTTQQDIAVDVLLTDTTAGNRVRFRIESEAGGATDLFGTIRIETETFGVGVVAGTQYSTLAKVKAAIGGTVDASHDDDINDVIEEVSRAFDAYVGVSFVATEQIEFHDGWLFRNGIALNRMPSDSSSQRDLATVEENGTLLTQGADWYFEPFPSRMIYRTNGTAESFQGARFAGGERGIKVTYNTAFVNLPLEIARACREESKRAFDGYNWTGATGGRIGLNSFTPAEGTVFDFTVDDLSPSTLRILRPYREGRYVG